MSELATPRSRESLVLFVAFASGLCALVYEVVWMRLFIPVFGLSVYSTTTVVCSFMAGLGLGSICAPRLLSLWNGSAFRLYALAEIGIGLAALALHFAIAPIENLYVAAAGWDGDGPFTAATRLLLAMAAMSVPTFFMGMTLPILVRACENRFGPDTAGGRRIGSLYGLNTLGGAIGCLVVGFVLIQHLGLWRTSCVTASVNFAVALLVYGLYGRSTAEKHPDSAAVSATVEAPLRGTSHSKSRRVVSRALLLWVFGISGLVSLAYELCWFRILVFYLQSATYSFSIMLSIFLLGIGLGSLVWSRLLEPRLARSPHAHRSGLRALAVVQASIAVWGLATLPLYVKLPSLWTVLIEKLGAGSFWMIELQKALIAGVMLFPPTLLMGITFPLVVRLYRGHHDPDERVVAHLYAANTVGAILGSLITGFVLFDWLGLQRTLQVLATTGLIVSAWCAIQAGGVLTRGWVLSAAVGCIALAVRTPDRLLVRNFEKYEGDVLFYRESAADITFVHQKGQYKTIAFNDGRGTSSTKPAVDYSNRILAYTAMAMQPEAKKILVISMGCGNTSSAFAQFPIERLDIVDISSGPFEAAHFFETNLDVLNDPRVFTHVEDGRNWLLKTQQSFDVIEIDLPTLHTEGIVNLYTHEFYEIARSKLEPGGVLLQWIDVAQSREEISYMCVHTMVDVFPNALVWAAGWQWWVTGVNGDEPIRFHHDRLAPLFHSAKVAKDLARVDSSLEDTLAKLVASGPRILERVGHAPMITDDRTLVDFLTPKLRTPTAFGGGVGYYSSPLQAVFRQAWSRESTFTEEEWGMFRFYERDEHLAKVAESLQEVLVGFPEESKELIGQRLR